MYSVYRVNTNTRAFLDAVSTEVTAKRRVYFLTKKYPGKKFIYIPR